MEGEEKMIGLCGTCWSKMFWESPRILMVLRKAVWIGDPDFCHFLVDVETM